MVVADRGETRQEKRTDEQIMNETSLKVFKNLKQIPGTINSKRFTQRKFIINCQKAKRKIL